MSYLDNPGVSYLWSKIKAAFAAKSHSHAASDITSGTLDAARIPNLSTDKLTSGTLPIARGGTGATTAAEARTSLDAAQSNGATGTLKAAEDAIGGLIKSLSAVEDTDIATKPHSSNDTGDSYVYVKSTNTFYKVYEEVLVGQSISAHARETNVYQMAFDFRRDLDASDITSGTLPIGRGGTGQDGTSYTEVVANVASAASGCTVTNAQYAQWGKVAQVLLGIKCDSAKAFNDTLATIVIGKRPVMLSVLTSTDGTVAFGVTTGGLVQAKSSISAGKTLYVIGTYLLP